MANNWAIAIGINQYHFFQPLSCAQSDAEALKEYLITEEGFLPQHCMLMTDTSPPFGDRSTYPTKDNILLLIEDLAAACWQPQDRLWLFFSGYAVNYCGRDYLIPVFGNPSRVEATGIEVRGLMQSLQATNLDVLLLLDINRPFGTQGDALVGQEIIELAQELQIPTILSCQPEQFSYESRELGHGLFTAALLEALRFGSSSTLTSLETYLSIRIPELCQHYWRPTQNPVTIIPSKEQKNDSFSIGDHSFVGTEETLSSLHPATFSSASFPHAPKTVAKTRFWSIFLLWGASTVVALSLFVVILFRNQAVFSFQKIFPAFSNKTSAAHTKTVSAPPTPISVLSTIPEPPQVQPSLQVPPKPDESKQRQQAMLELTKMSLRPTQASDISKAIAKARKVTRDEPLYEQAQTNIRIWNRMILDLAESRAKKRYYTDAIAAAQLISKDHPLYQQAQAGIMQWRLEARQYLANKTLIQAANALIEHRQASTYNRAIEVAKKVPFDEPGFDIAEQSINQWSNRILELAKKRAARGEIASAVDTAVLVPQGTAAYDEAQKAIQQWQKK
jgi:hypothetical protein